MFELRDHGKEKCWDSCEFPGTNGFSSTELLSPDSPVGTGLKDSVLLKSSINCLPTAKDCILKKENHCDSCEFPGTKEFSSPESFSPDSLTNIELKGSVLLKSSTDYLLTIKKNILKNKNSNFVRGTTSEKYSDSLCSSQSNQSGFVYRWTRPKSIIHVPKIDLVANKKNHTKSMKFKCYRKPHSIAAPNKFIVSSQMNQNQQQAQTKYNSKLKASNVEESTIFNEKNLISCKMLNVENINTETPSIEPQVNKIPKISNYKHQQFGPGKMTIKVIKRNDKQKLPHKQMVNKNKSIVPKSSNVTMIEVFMPSLTNEMKKNVQRISKIPVANKHNKDLVATNIKKLAVKEVKIQPKKSIDNVIEDKVNNPVVLIEKKPLEKKKGITEKTYNKISSLYHYIKFAEEIFPSKQIKKISEDKKQNKQSCIDNQCLYVDKWIKNLSTEKQSINSTHISPVPKVFNKSFHKQEYSHTSPVKQSFRKQEYSHTSPVNKFVRKQEYSRINPVNKFVRKKEYSYISPANKSYHKQEHSDASPVNQSFHRQEYSYTSPVNKLFHKQKSFNTSSANKSFYKQKYSHISSGNKTIQEDPRPDKNNSKDFGYAKLAITLNDLGVFDSEESFTKQMRNKKSWSMEDWSKNQEKTKKLLTYKQIYLETRALNNLEKLNKERKQVFYEQLKNKKGLLLEKFNATNTDIRDIVATETPTLLNNELDKNSFEPKVLESLLNNSKDFSRLSKRGSKLKNSITVRTHKNKGNSKKQKYMGKTQKLNKSIIF